MSFLNPSINPTVQHSIVVSIGDMAVSGELNSVLSTYAIGTCVGVVVCDSKSGVGGMLHFVLADSSLCREKAKKRPAMFADTGIPELLKEFEKNRGSLVHAKILLAGGASVLGGSSSFDVGKKNIEAAKRIMKEEGLNVAVEDLGGVNNRTLYFNLESGDVTIKTPAGSKTISLK